MIFRSQSNGASLAWRLLISTVTVRELNDDVENQNTKRGVGGNAGDWDVSPPDSFKSPNSPSDITRL